MRTTLPWLVTCLLLVPLVLGADAPSPVAKPTWPSGPGHQLIVYGLALSAAADYDVTQVGCWIDPDSALSSPPPPVVPAAGWLFDTRLSIDWRGGENPVAMLVGTGTDGATYSARISGTPAGAVMPRPSAPPADGSGTSYIINVIRERVVLQDDPFHDLPSGSRTLFGIASAYRWVPPVSQGSPRALERTLGLTVPPATIQFLEDDLGPIDLLEASDGNVVFHFSHEGIDVWYRCRTLHSRSTLSATVGYARSDQPNHPSARLISEAAQMSPASITLDQL